MRRMLAFSILAVVAGCGGGEDDPSAPQRPATGPSPEAVVRGWAADLRRGDIDAAADRFAVPAIVANGTPEARLETRVQVRAFNDELPCGGRVVRTRRRQGFVVARFVLTDRPGGDCGAGTGGTATTAFEIRSGKIVRWIRLPEGDEAPPPTGPVA